MKRLIANSSTTSSRTSAKCNAPDSRLIPMPHDPINTGYARALFEMARAEGVVTRVEEELFRLRELLKKNPDLLEFLKDPNVKHEGKRQALTTIFQGRTHPLDRK